MSDAERSIAVKRKVGVTKPMGRDDSPSEVYTPKRKRSNDAQEEASPPPYIPSRKTSSDRHNQNSSHIQHSESRQLSHDDVRHTLGQESRRELISKSRREELLRTIGIDRGSFNKSESSRSSERDRRRSEGDKTVVYAREVKSDRSSRAVKNFQITTRVVSPGSSSVAVSDTRQKHSLSPEPEQHLQVIRSPVRQDSKTSITARLGKVVVERKDMSKQKDAREDINTRVGLTRTSSDRKDLQRDAREDILAKVAQSKSKDNLMKKSSARVISRMGKEFVQKQCKAAVLSVQSSGQIEKSKVAVSPDSRVVQCDEDSSHSGNGEKDADVDYQEYKRSISKSEPAMDGSNSSVKSKGSDGGDDDETEDLAKMIDDDIEPELLDDTHNDEFTLDLDDDDDISNVVGAIEKEAAEAELQEQEKDQGSKSGTRFIVTLDGVDERQFETEDNNSIFEKLKRPPLGSASVPVAPTAASSSEQVQQNQKLFLDILAAQGRPLQQPLLQQVLTPTQNVYSKLTPPKIQPFSISLKDSDDEHDDKETKPPATRPESYYEGQGHTEEDSGFSAIKRAKMSERCKFWPACAAGTSCEYHHPTTHCKTFPNCKFGDKCLFIHPNCRFDSKCARPDCPYTHTSRRANLSSAPHIIAIPPSHVVLSPAPPKQHYNSLVASGYPNNQTQCRYFPNCHNLNCPFVHPKPCRFGMACKSPTCPFYHPPVPGKDKLKWQAQDSKQKTLETNPGTRTDLPVMKTPSSAGTQANQTVSSTSQ